MATAATTATTATTDASWDAGCSGTRGASGASGDNGAGTGLPLVVAPTPTCTGGDGDTLLQLTHAPLDVAACLDFVTLPSTGASTLFVGTTRDNFGGRAVVRLEYEAYAPMALRELAALCAGARTRWALPRVAILHRLGAVPVREASVVIAVSSAHRHDALVALQYLIDTLKARVPIWKKEWYADDTGAWKANAEARVVARDPAPAPGPDPHPPVVAKEDTGL
jgi:molybdopterin synthase catalytic subunit